MAENTTAAAPGAGLPFKVWSPEHGMYFESFVFDKKTGERRLCHPVDVAELIASGRYSREPIRGHAAAAERDAVYLPEPPAEVEDGHVASLKQQVDFLQAQLTAALGGDAKTAGASAGMPPAFVTGGPVLSGGALHSGPVVADPEDKKRPGRPRTSTPE